jgi:hypothetical protein
MSVLEMIAIALLLVWTPSVLLMAYLLLPRQRAT